MMIHPRHGRERNQVIRTSVVVHALSSNSAEISETSEEMNKGQRDGTATLANSSSIHSHSSDVMGTASCGPTLDICKYAEVDDISDSTDPEYSTADEVLHTPSAKKKSFQSGSLRCQRQKKKRQKKTEEPSEKMPVGSGFNPEELSLRDAPFSDVDNEFSCFQSFTFGDSAHIASHVYIDELFNADELSLSSDTSDDDDTMESTQSFLHHLGDFQENAQCEICYEEKPLYLRSCCQNPFCDACLNTYCQFLVENGSINFPCPSRNCDMPIYQNEVFSRLEKEFKSKLYRNLVNANNDPLKKTCPQCCEVMSLSSDVKLKDRQLRKNGLMVTCARCRFDWCFMCHSPWHKGITCKQNRKGDKLLQKWARQIEAGQVNARRCPKCKIFIQRKSGCDHMTCSKCGMNFCYRCGCAFRSMRFLGNHYSKFSIFGCKYLLLPNKPGLRRLIRGSIFGAEIVVAPVLGALALVAGVAVFAGAVVASPVLVGLMIRKKQSHKRYERAVREIQNLHEQRIEAIHRLGDPYLEKYSHLQQIGVVNMWHMYRTAVEQAQVPAEIITI